MSKTAWESQVSRADKVTILTKRLVSEVIVGYENEQQPTWPDNVKQHQCQVCYNTAKRLRDVLENHDER